MHAKGHATHASHVCSSAAASSLACQSVLPHNRSRPAEHGGRYSRQQWSACLNAAAHVPYMMLTAGQPHQGETLQTKSSRGDVQQLAPPHQLLAPAAGQQGHTTTPQELTLLEDILAYGLQDTVPLWPSTQASRSSSGRNGRSMHARLAELLPFVHPFPGEGMAPVGPHSKPAIDPLVEALRQLQSRLGRRESSVASSS